MPDAFDPRVNPWQIDASEFDELESRHEQMQFLLRFAVLAPSNRFNLVLPDEQHQAAELIDYAERLQMARPALRAEMADWIRADDGLHTDGIPAEAFGIPRVLASGASWFVRQFKAGAWHGARDRRLADSASALLIVCADDDRVSLLRAGEALEQLLVTITDAGLQYSFLNQAIEVKTLRERVQMLAGSKSPAQLLIRIGSALPVDHRTPRRTVEAVIARMDLP